MLRPTFAALAPAVLLAVAGAATAGGPDAAGVDFFEKRIRPVLIEHCYKCHSAQVKSPKGGLRLDTREGARTGGDSGPAVVPGNAAASLLLKAVRSTDATRRMPPAGKLPASVLADLDKWIAMGAPDPRTASVVAKGPADPDKARSHWAFQPVNPHPMPAVKNTAWPQTPVDRFVLARLEERGLPPSPPAERRTLIRRVTYDLTGLPPTPEEVRAFLADNSPGAFARVVDRLLASPHYGEHWGRHWLDVVRYADTAGETADFPAPHAWRYRNYVIDAINADMPYDQFLREQLAGDVLAASAPRGRYADLVTATGYLAIARRFGYDIAKDHYLTIEDTIDTLGKSVLGLTVACARCHDHKYDPVSAADYYGLYGIFASTRYAFPGCEKEQRPRDMVPLFPPVKPSASLYRKVGEKGSGAVILKPPTPFPPPSGTDSQKGEKIEVAYAVREGKPRNARVHRRGDPEKLGEEVPRRFLQFLGGQVVPPDGGSGRLALAGWLTDPANPLTARVMVNRIWQHHFGRGLVNTPNDFGTRGSPPSHPELLDDLARRFVAGGWSVKTMHRLILLSATYRQSSRLDPQAVRTDPDNVWMSHFSRRRLSAEEIRDAILAVCGELERTRGGPHPFPDEKKWGFTQHNPFTAVFDHDRRSVYLMTQRLKRHSFLALFDGADPNSSTAHRDTTTVPTQALFFLNDPFVHAKSARLAERLLALPDDDARLDRVAQLCLGRPPTPRERELGARFLHGYAGPDADGSRRAWAAWVRVLLASNEFLYVD